MGEAYFINKQYDLALESYKKAIILDGTNGNAEKIIEKIEKEMGESKIFKLVQIKSIPEIPERFSFIVDHSKEIFPLNIKKPYIVLIWSSSPKTPYSTIKYC